MNESEIIKRILAGEDRFFTDLVHRRCGHVWAICRSYIPNRSDCEEVTQEVFLQCYRQLHTLRNPEAFSAWITQTARRCSLMWLRSVDRNRKQMTQYEQVRNISDFQTSRREQERVENNDMHRYLWETIEKLPPDHREILLLHYAEGYTAEECAILLGITAPAVRKRLERARNLLKEQFWNELEEGMARERHQQRLVQAISAAIPLGGAPWLNFPAGSPVSTPSFTASLFPKGIPVMFKYVLAGLCGLTLMTGITGYTLFQNHGADSGIPPTRTPILSADSRPGENTPAAPKAEKIAMASLPAPADSPKESGGSESDSSIPVRPACISGSVSDVSGKPVAGAAINLDISCNGDYNDPCKTFSVVSGSDGSFRIAGIDAFGKGLLFAGMSGYVMQRHTMNIQEGMSNIRKEITLTPAEHYVQGHVRDDKGASIAGAVVDLMYFGYDLSGLVHTAITGTTTGTIGGCRFAYTATDDKGAFTLAIPYEGRCDFRISKPGYGPGFLAKIETGTQDAACTLHPESTVTGKVTDPEGNPMAGETVQVLGTVLPGNLPFSIAAVQTLPAVPITTTTDNQGNFTAKGLGVDYTYSVQIPAYKIAVPDAQSREENKRTGYLIITDMMRDFENCMARTSDARTKKENIRVKPGAVESIALTMDPRKKMILYGKVTDRNTGQPVCPIVVTASAVVNGKNISWAQSKSGSTTVTRPDGSYRMELSTEDKCRQYWIGYVYMTEGGSSWDQPDESMAIVEMDGEKEKEINFAVDAPCNVPVRYVNTAGNPCEGIEAAMRQSGGCGGCGGMLISDHDGRVMFHGIRPGIMLEALAWQSSKNDLETIGVSEPYSGKPGETVSEITVVCRKMGGVEGHIAYADARPVENRVVMAEAREESNSKEKLTTSFTTDANGDFSSPDGIQEGAYDAQIWFLDKESGRIYGSETQHIIITADNLTALEPITVKPIRDFEKVVQAADCGRRTNEIIAENYSPEAIAAITDPYILLRGGMALYDTAQYPEALRFFEKMADLSEEKSVEKAMACIWQGQMLDLMNRREEAVSAYRQAIETGINESIQHDQFKLQYEPVAYGKERIAHPFTRLENNLP